MTENEFKNSFIDRLCGASITSSIEAVREMVRRDLEDLLNARQGRCDIPSWFMEVRRSFAYGLGDFESTNLESANDRQRLLNTIKSTIAFFEPRLQNVVVTDSGIIHPFILHFQIRATLKIGTFVDKVVFGTTIQKNGTTTVKA
jgi:type VI secretion system lysozyme-like protein